MKKMPLDKIRHRFNTLTEEWARFKGAFDAFLSELDGELQKLSEENSSEHAPEKSRKSQKAATQQTGSFPYPVGILVRVAFPELFKRKAISAGDIAYLLSKKAADDFLTRGTRVIKLYTIWTPFKDFCQINILIHNYSSIDFLNLFSPLFRFGESRIQSSG